MDAEGQSEGVLRGAEGEAGGILRIHARRKLVQKSEQVAVAAAAAAAADRWIVMRLGEGVAAVHSPGQHPTAGQAEAAVQPTQVKAEEAGAELLEPVLPPSFHYLPRLHPLTSCFQHCCCCYCCYYCYECDCRDHGLLRPQAR